MDTGSMPIKVLLIDDHKSFSEGLTMLISTCKSAMKVVGTVSNSKEAIELAARTEPDIILLDVDLGDENGIEILPELNNKTGAKIIILTGTQNPTTHENAVMRGARGVLLKSDSGEIILKAIKSVHKGEMWLNNHTLSKVLSRFRQQTDSDGKKYTDPDGEKIATLTAREREIIKNLFNNDPSTNKEVAHRLFISDSTLKNHLTTIYGKLEIKNRIELYKYALKHKLDAN